MTPSPSASLPESPPQPVMPCAAVRYGLLVFGWLNLCLGVLGAFLPLMPTTIFLIMALWAFSRSSLRFHGWLYHHPRFGPPLQAWHKHRVIPLPAKLFAVGMMLASLIYISVFVAENWLLPLGLSLMLGAVATYILTRPHRIAS